MPNRALIVALVVAVIIGLWVYIPKARDALSPRAEPETVAQHAPSPSPQPSPSPSTTPSPLPYTVLEDEWPLTTLARLDWGRSPFDILVPGVQLLVYATTPQEGATGITPLVLQAIFSGTKGNIAKISGVLVREGDSIFDAIVLSISLSKRAVEIRRGDGTIEILRVFPTQ